MAASTGKTASEAARRYAGALFDLALEAGDLPAVAKDIAALSDMVAGSDDLGRLLSSPAFLREDKVRAVTALSDAAGFGQTVTGFVGTMAQNGRSADLPAALSVFDELHAKHRGVKRAVARTAQPMSADQRTRLEAVLAKAVGSDVELETEVDQALVGGIQLQIGSTLVDASVATKLDRMNTAMKGA